MKFALTPAAIIAKKRDRLALSETEIRQFVFKYAADELPSYQMSAFAMAIYLNGMTDLETAYLTQAMLDSGARFQWHSELPARVDKHSTGGVGDKISLILAPLLASCGLRVPMISGRGLGPTGGTLDKLESIPGFRTDLSMREAQQICESIGCVITGASDEIAPADRKLYALRDVTATVASIPLITASIMSKKLAENLSALVLDVKHGSGAFMKNLSDAKRLAESLTGVGKQMGVLTSALLTDMNQPLGRMAGNAVEVDESLETLSGEGPEDVRELTLALGAELLTATGVRADHQAAIGLLREHLDSGAARQQFERMVRAQGGDLSAARVLAPESVVIAPRDGFLTAVDVQRLGMVMIELGGGRKQMSDAIDHSVGLEMLVRLGDEVRFGQPLVRVFAKPDTGHAVHAEVAAALLIADEHAAPPPLLVGRE